MHAHARSIDFIGTLYLYLFVYLFIILKGQGCQQIMNNTQTREKSVLSITLARIFHCLISMLIVLWKPILDEQSISRNALK